MKTFIFSIICLFTLCQNGKSQSVPQGMKYQAVARDAKGQLMSNQNVQLRVTLYSDPQLQNVKYAETHELITNDLGLMTITIGEGSREHGKFAAVPWSEEEIWMAIAIYSEEQNDYVTISDSRMLSVPYAFHAATASELTGNTDTDRGPLSGSGSTTPGQTWALLGNLNTDSSRDKIGTLDMQDLVVVTNSLERLRVDATGDINVANSLSVNEDLAVGGDAHLNLEGGNTVNHGDLHVANQSNTFLSGRLMVDGQTYLNLSLDVEGQTRLHNSLDVEGPSYLANSLEVDESTRLHKTLEVDGATTLHKSLTANDDVNITDGTQATSTSTGALVVEGGVGIGKDLYVGGDANFTGMTNFSNIIEITNTTQSYSPLDGALVVAGGVGIGKNLNIGGQMKVGTSNADFAAEIFNTYEGAGGDGLLIKLNRTHPAWDGNGYAHLTNFVTAPVDSAIATVAGWVHGETFDPADILHLNANFYYLGTACNIVNIVTDEINDKLDLPKGIPSLGTFPGFTWGGFDMPDPIPNIPGFTIPGFSTPALPLLPKIPAIPCDDLGLESLTLPNLEFTDVQNSLTGDNEFISFRDKANRELGSIRAESITEWQSNFFDGQYFVDLMGEVIGIDLLSGYVGAINKFSEIADSYNEIGVVYTSGNGDYAEWLERQDHNEQISAADIVAVRGGKISKDLTDAEQIMAVSGKPIVLGNMPEENREHLGHTIAFMGQIPVKVMGPVHSGDYIIGNNDTPGYGIAVNPSDMTADYMKLLVGRSWETNLKPGPKMVNTVIGVDNGGFLDILKSQRDNLTAMEERLASLENALSLLLQESAQASNE